MTTLTKDQADFVLVCDGQMTFEEYERLHPTEPDMKVIIFHGDSNSIQLEGRHWHQHTVHFDSDGNREEEHRRWPAFSPAFPKVARRRKFLVPAF